MSTVNPLDPVTPARRESLRSGLRTVAVLLAAGLLSGLLWVWLAPSPVTTEVDGEAAVTSDLVLGVIGLVAGFVAGLGCALAGRRRPATLVAAVAVGSLIAAGAAVLVGTVMGAPPVRAWPVVLALPIGALIAVVGVLVSSDGGGQAESADTIDAVDAQAEADASG